MVGVRDGPPDNELLQGGADAEVRDLGNDEVVDHRTTDFATVLSGSDVALDSLAGPPSRGP